MISSILSCYILHCVCIRVSSHVCDRMSCICMLMYACEGLARRYTRRAGKPPYLSVAGKPIYIRAAKKPPYLCAAQHRAGKPPYLRAASKHLYLGAAQANRQSSARRVYLRARPSHAYINMQMQDIRSQTCEDTRMQTQWRI